LCRTLRLTIEHAHQQPTGAQTLSADGQGHADE